MKRFQKKSRPEKKSRLNAHMMTKSGREQHTEQQRDSSTERERARRQQRRQTTEKRREVAVSIHFKKQFINFLKKLLFKTKTEAEEKKRGRNVKNKRNEIQNSSCEANIYQLIVTVTKRSTIYKPCSRGWGAYLHVLCVRRRMILSV